jgi:hypothetical protein
LRGKPEDWLTLQRRWREQFRAEYRELRRAAGSATSGGAHAANSDAGPGTDGAATGGSARVADTGAVP